jgi:hypothetical protein
MKFKNIEELQLSFEWSKVAMNISDLAETLMTVELGIPLKDCLRCEESIDDIYTEEAQEVYNVNYDIIESEVFRILKLDY